MPRFLWLLVALPVVVGCPMESPPPPRSGPPPTVGPGGPPPTTPDQENDVLTVPPSVKP